MSQNDWNIVKEYKILVQLNTNSWMEKQAAKKLISMCHSDYLSVIKNKMCLWNTNAPGGNKVKMWQNLYVLHFDPEPTPGAYDVSEVRATFRWTYSSSLVSVIRKDGMMEWRKGVTLYAPAHFMAGA